MTTVLLISQKDPEPVSSVSRRPHITPAPYLEDIGSTSVPSSEHTTFIVLKHVTMQRVLFLLFTALDHSIHYLQRMKVALFQRQNSVLLFISDDVKSKMECVANNKKVIKLPQPIWIPLNSWLRKRDFNI